MIISNCSHVEDPFFACTSDILVFAQSRNPKSCPRLTLLSSEPDHSYPDIIARQTLRRHFFSSSSACYLLVLFIESSPSFLLFGTLLHSSYIHTPFLSLFLSFNWYHLHTYNFFGAFCIQKDIFWSVFLPLKSSTLVSTPRSDSRSHLLDADERAAFLYIYSLPRFSFRVCSTSWSYASEKLSSFLPIFFFQFTLFLPLTLLLTFLFRISYLSHASNRIIIRSLRNSFSRNTSAYQNARNKVRYKQLRP